MANGEVVSHVLMEDRLLEKYKGKGAVSNVLTGTYREQVEEAFQAMNRERGYKPKVRFSSRFRSAKVKH